MLSETHEVSPVISNFKRPLQFVRYIGTLKYPMPKNYWLIDTARVVGQGARQCKMCVASWMCTRGAGCKYTDSQCKTECIDSLQTEWFHYELTSSSSSSPHPAGMVSAVTDCTMAASFTVSLTDSSLLAMPKSFKITSARMQKPAEHRLTQMFRLSRHEWHNWLWQLRHWFSLNDAATAKWVTNNWCHALCTAACTYRFTRLRDGQMDEWWQRVRHALHSISVTSQRDPVSAVCSAWAHQQLQPLIDWLIEHGFTSAPTQYRLYGRRSFSHWLNLIYAKFCSPWDGRACSS